MKRFIAYNALVAAAFLLLWSLIVVVEVRISNYPFLRYIFFGSLPLVFVSFFIAGLRAFRDGPEHAAGAAALCGLLIAVVFIVFGVILVTNFKLAIGGRI